MLNRVIHFRIWMLLVLVAGAALGFAAVRYQVDRGDIREAIRRLRTGNAKEREAASYDLTYYATTDGSGIGELVSALEDEDPEVIESVRRILWMVPAKFRTSDYLQREMLHGTPSGRFQAVRLLCENIRPSRECLDVLLKAYREDRNPRLRALALETLMKSHFLTDVVANDFHRWDQAAKLDFLRRLRGVFL